MSFYETGNHASLQLALFLIPVSDTLQQFKYLGSALTGDSMCNTEFRKSIGMGKDASKR